MRRDTWDGLREHDLLLYAAAVTFYAGVAVVPSLLVALWGLGLVLGAPRMAEYADRLSAALPDSLGAPAAAQALVQAGTRLGLLSALIAVLPASLYGEGLRRAFAYQADRAAQTGSGWRGRLRVLPLFALAPALVLVVLGVTPLLARLFATGEAGPTVLGIYLSFLADWLAVSVPLTYVYRVVAPTSLSWRAAAWAGFATGAMLAGFVQGFVLFLALPLDIGRPFGGLRVVGLTVALGLWLWLLHLLVLVGYELAGQIEARGGLPWRPRR